MYSSLCNVTQQLDYTFFKTKSARIPTMTSTFLSLPGQEVHFIFQHWKSHQNSLTDFMSLERIRLLFTNFPLVSVSQYNENRIQNVIFLLARGMLAKMAMNRIRTHACTNSSFSFGPIVSSDAEFCCLKPVHSVIIESRQNKCPNWRVVQVTGS